MTQATVSHQIRPDKHHAPPWPGDQAVRRVHVMAKPGGAVSDRDWASRSIPYCGTDDGTVQTATTELSIVHASDLLGRTVPSKSPTVAAVTKDDYREALFYGINIRLAIDRHSSARIAHVANGEVLRMQAGVLRSAGGVLRMRVL